MSNGMPSWEEWHGQLTDEQRDYSLYKVLDSLDRRLAKVERRSIVDKVCAFGGGFAGGFTAIVAKWAFWK
jgi:hypothetical protein